MRPLMLLLLVTIFLGACETAPFETPRACVPLREYTLEQQGALADAVDALPESSPLIPAMLDYSRMRDQARACLTQRNRA